MYVLITDSKFFCTLCNISKHRIRVHIAGAALVLVAKATDPDLERVRPPQSMNIKLKNGHFKYHG